MSSRHIEAGHGVLYGEYIMVPTKVLIWDSCPLRPTRNIDRSSGRVLRQPPQQRVLGFVDSSSWQGAFTSDGVEVRMLRGVRHWEPGAHPWLPRYLLRFHSLQGHMRVHEKCVNENSYNK